MLNHYISVDKKVVEDCIRDYYSNTSFRTKAMAKADPKVHIDYFTQLASDTLNSKLTFVSGNYYKHTIPYLPHTDYKKQLNNPVNLVIPLEITGTASLIVFDQQWLDDSVTWDMNYKITDELKTNTFTRGSPNTYNITNKTEMAFDSNIHKHHLRYFKLEDLHSLSAEVFEFVPNKAILFDNRKIHCTSHFEGEKLGLSLRFKYEDTNAREH
jgi:hypothetical protein